MLHIFLFITQIHMLYIHNVILIVDISDDYSFQKLKLAVKILLTRRKVIYQV